MPIMPFYPTRSEDFIVQPVLFPLPVPLPAEDSPLQKRFEQFHAANPQVFERLRTLALTRQAAGAKRWSIKAAWEAIRWDARFVIHGDTYKLCNSYHSFYARLLMEREPRLRGFFATRKQTA